MEKRKINPRQTSNVFSKILFLYTLPLFKKGLKKELDEKDLYEILPGYSSQTLGNLAVDEWNKQKHRKSAMFVLFWNLFGKYYLLLGCTKLISIILNICQPIIIAKLVSFFVPGQTNLATSSVYLYSFLLISLSFIDTVYRQNYFLVAESLAIKFRTAMSCLIYRKFLTLPIRKLKNASFGKIENLLTRDVAAFEQLFLILNESFSGGVTILIICYTIYWRIGMAVIVVILAFAGFLPCLVYCGIIISRLKIKTSEKTDERINIVQKILSDIKASKMYVWENYLEKIIIQARKDEISIFLRMCIVLFLVLAMGILVQYITFYVIMLTCIWLDITITAESMYFLYSAFLAMSFAIGTAFPYSAFSGAQAVAALKRLQKVVKHLDVTVITKYEDTTKKPKICFKHVLVTVNNRIELKDINLDINGGLSLLLGPTASGKTLFFLTILKEIEVECGSLEIRGAVSYASQEPWLYPSTIRKNITFGEEFNQRRYHQVINVCALQYDLDLLENGDETIVSDQGSNLSKGQQCRINLARAVYKNSDIYLLDNCFSNLDPIVADIIFSNCIMGFLKNKIVFLVTDNLSLRKHADNVITISNGEVEVEHNWQIAKKETCKDSFSSFIFNNVNGHDVWDESVEGQLVDPINNIYMENKKIGSISTRVYKQYVGSTNV